MKILTQSLAVAVFVTLCGQAFAECSYAPGGDNKPCTDEKGAAASIGRWRVTSETSPMDDSKTVVAILQSTSMVPGKYGGPSGQAEIALRCMENTTAVIFSVNDYFLADIQGYGVVEYRIDDKKAAKINTQESTDNMALGLWSGKRAIPFIKGLYGGEKLTLRITPFNESPITMDFDMKGVEDATKELRAACGW